MNLRDRTPALFVNGTYASLVQKAICMIAAVALLPLAGVQARSAQTESLEEKLKTVTDYVPKSTASVDQLVEVARRFRIPMAIEWVERAYAPTVDEIPKEKRSVKELLELIAGASSGLRIEVDGGLVRIYSPFEAAHPFNLLNIRLKSYSAIERDLFGAEDELRWAIRFALEPEKYLNGGYGGGYGHGAQHVFEIPKFTLSASNVTVRDVLDRIALAQGNALWVVIVNESDLNGDTPVWRQHDADDGARPVTAAWHFTPLAEISELAKEQVVIDVMIAGLLDQRMTTVPVMLADCLTENASGAMGGSSSEGRSFHYWAHLEGIGKEFVTVSVHLNVERSGEPDFKFDKKLQIYRDHKIELQPDPEIRIRAYFEPTKNPSTN